MAAFIVIKIERISTNFISRGIIQNLKENEGKSGFCEI
jgi:hypothetical protein